jgi:hypothetical protein
MSKDICPVLKLVANTNLASSDFKSIILRDSQLLIVMTTRRPNLTNSGTTASKKDPGIDNLRMIIPNSQIY